MKRTVVIMVAILSLSGLNAAAQGLRLSQPDEVGGGITALHPDGANGPGIESSSIGPGLDLFVKYQINPTFSLSAGTGFYTAMDKSFAWDTYKMTMFPTVEVKAYVMPGRNQKVMPMAFAGLQAFGWKFTTKVLGETFTSDKTFFDAAFLLGAGVQFAVNEKTNFFLSGDYRYVFTPDGDEKPKFWAAKAGLSFALNRPGRSYRPEDEIEYPMGEQELATLDDLFKEGGSGSGGDDDALSLLFQPEQGAAGGGDISEDTGENPDGDLSEDDLSSLFAEEEAAPDAEITATYPETEIGQLMAKVDRLKDQMDEKSRQIEALEAKVDVKGSFANADLSSVPDTEFKNRYASALDKFHMKLYREAISDFEKLAGSNPRHVLTSNCRYWIGECYNAMGDYRKALSEFQSVLNYRSSFKLDDALIMSGLCYLKIGDNSTARNQFQELVNRYPDSEYAPKAMRYLGSL